MEFETILDIGCGEGFHAELFRRAGKQVITNNLYQPADHVGDYLGIRFNEQFDCIWASHVLEHQPDAGRFLRKCFADLKDNGILAVTVPPLKHSIVGGHLSLWNAGLLLYNLILAGFDCSQAKVRTYGYNISVIVRKKAANLPTLTMDYGDIERLAAFFPMPVTHGFDGQLRDIN